MWTRIFPLMMSKLNPYFSFQDSRFNVHKSKEAKLKGKLGPARGILSVASPKQSWANSRTATLLCSPALQ